MHSGIPEKAGSLRKRTLSRGMSEDESLQHIVRDAEESSRHLSRSESRYGSLKRGQRQESNSEDDLHSENLETDSVQMELRASYEDCLQEVRPLEVLLFQVDCLQDALESTEEMLAETQRDNHSLTMELERERAMRRTSEDIIASLKRELERSREERAGEWSEGTSVDWDEQPLTHTSLFLSLKHEAQAAEESDESSGYEDAPSPSTPDTEEEGHSKNTDSCALS